MSKYPSRLAQSPLFEAIFEMRFSPMPGSVELLPGVMFAALGKEFPRIVHMPLGSVPKELRDSKPELRHAPVLKLQGQGEAVLMGDRVVSFNTSRPYPGWSQFRSRAIQVASALKASGQVSSLERYSLKYVNMIEEPKASHPAAPFNLRVEANSFELSPQGFRLRFETKIKGFTNIVEYISGVDAIFDKEKRRGTMMTLDTIKEPAELGFGTT